MAIGKVDVVGIGLNATDTVMRVPRFPAVGGKERVAATSIEPGGQMTTALVACRRLGLKVRYIGKVGDDPAGEVQLASLRREGFEMTYVKVVPGAGTQFGNIIVDQSTGERTVFWDRDRRLAMKASELDPASITSARLLHLDGCDVHAALAAARWARKAGMPVLADLDTVYPRVEKLFPWIDYLIASTQFVPAVTGYTDPFQGLECLARKYGVRSAGMTVGRDGALVHHQGRFHYSPGFQVETVDTTGAGDVFHGAFAYAVLAGWEMPHTLDFANALAALNCMALGARGGIKNRAAAERLMQTGARHVNRDYQGSGSTAREA